MTTAEQARALGPDLVSAFVRISGGPTKTAAYLSMACTRRYSANKVCRWRRGAESVPAGVQEIMRAVVALKLLGADGLAIAIVMSPPAMKKAPEAGLPSGALNR